MSRPAAVRRSAVHACLERLDPTWDQRGGALCPLHFGDPQAEAAVAPVLALADRGWLPRMGLKGPGAIAWARAQGISVPDRIYGWTRAADGALTVRVGGGELFLQGAQVAAVEAALASRAHDRGCWPVRREDAALLLGGARAPQVLAQACSFDVRAAAGRFVMTRVAMISCAILIEEDAAGVPVYHLWAAASYGSYLWDELLAIVQECGGGPVGDLAASALLSTRYTATRDEKKG